MTTIKLDIDILFFVYLYELLKKNLDTNSDPFKNAMLQKTYDYVANELAEQYSDQLGEYLEYRNLVEKAMFMNKN
tara:strand:- start:503 stop:727 length:225 start_codon:yes stop_codon:yes gene_type:complete